VSYLIKTVLFDLDGTLLPLDHDQFAKEYFTYLGAKVAHITDSRRFVNQLLASTGVMIANQNKNKTNQQVFYEDFLAKVDVAEDILLPIIDDFYENDFSRIKVATRPDPAALRAVSTALDNGADVVVATNPVFPLTAVRQRLQWAGVGEVDFSLVTSYEWSHYCKPNLDYYLEITDTLGCNPRECLMIGNDVDEDLVAADLGMRTYLVTDCLLNKSGQQPVADYSGTLLEMADNLKEIIKAG
jgi:FMN phosphatase YigB (HAD superfamily)